MATSSILTNFTITDAKTAEAFVEALEAASKEPEWRPSSPVNPPLRDRSAILALLAKRKETP